MKDNIKILSIHLRQGLSSSLFQSNFLNPHPPHSRHTPFLLILLDFITQMTLGEKYWCLQKVSAFPHVTMLDDLSSGFYKQTTTFFQHVETFEITFTAAVWSFYKFRYEACSTTINFFTNSFQLRGVRDSAVGIATRYGLDGPGIESRWGRDFPHPSRPALGCTQPRIKLVQCLSRVWRWPPTPSSVKVEGRVELYVCSLSAPSWPFLGWTSN
jgi:hypothetical protein